MAGSTLLLSRPLGWLTHTQASRVSSTGFPSQSAEPTLPSAVVYKGLSQLSCSHTLRAGSPIHTPSGPAIPYCSGEVQVLSTVAGKRPGKLSFSHEPEPILLTTMGGEEQVGKASLPHPCHLCQTRGRASSLKILPSGLAQLCPCHQGQHSWAVQERCKA